MITPFIYYSHNHFRPEDNRSALAIYEESERLRLAVKAATGYSWDSTHFVFQTSGGQPGLFMTFATEEQGVEPGEKFTDCVISCWSARTGCVIGEISLGRSGTQERKDAIELMQDWAEKAAVGKAFCGVCHKWVDAFKHYDFAGSVCLTCYNPKIHHAPDTSGT
jgi:hypothetical protein